MKKVLLLSVACGKVPPGRRQLLQALPVGQDFRLIVVHTCSPLKSPALSSSSGSSRRFIVSLLHS